MVGNNSAYADHINKWFKQIPEDIVAHKQIHELGFNPIYSKYNVPKFNNIKTWNDRDIASILVIAYTYLDYVPRLEQGYSQLRKDIDKYEPVAFDMAYRTIKLIDKLDYKNVGDHKHFISELIQIFARELYTETYPPPENTLYPAHVINDEGIWKLHFV